MALEDLIARSGAENFETMRRGWLPTQDEKRARSLADLQVQQTQQKVDYEPERQKMKRREANTLETQRQILIKKTKRQIKKADTDEKWDLQKRNFATTSRFIKGAFNLYSESNNISDALNIFRENYDEIIEVGDDGTDKAVNRILDPNTSEDEVINTLKSLNSLIPSVQDQMDKEDLARYKKSGGTLYERLKLRKELGIADKQDLKTLEKLSGEVASDQFKKTLTFKEKKERKRGTDALGTQYRKEYKLFISTDKQITNIKNALKSGDNAAMDNQVTSMLSNLGSTGIRAKSMYDIHDAPLGNIMERIEDRVSQFIGGVKTDFQKQEILDAVNDLQKYNNLVLNDGRGKFRSLARKQDYDVSTVVPFETFKAVQEYYKKGFWTKEQAAEYIEQNPRLLKGMKR